jgi:hypothetical protein
MNSGNSSNLRPLVVRGAHRHLDLDRPLDRRVRGWQREPAAHAGHDHDQPGRGAETQHGLAQPMLGSVLHPLARPVEIREQRAQVLAHDVVVRELVSEPREARAQARTLRRLRSVPRRGAEIVPQPLVAQLLVDPDECTLDLVQPSFRRRTHLSRLLSSSRPDGTGAARPLEPPPPGRVRSGSQVPRSVFDGHVPSLRHVHKERSQNHEGAS